MDEIRMAAFLALFLLGGCAVTRDAVREDPVTDFDALWDYDNPGQTEAEFRRLLPAAEESRSCFRLVCDVLSKDEWMAANEPERLARLRALGEKGSE